MNEIAIQTRNIIDNIKPEEGIIKIKNAGFSAIDFSLNNYLNNKDIYNFEINNFFDASIDELKKHFETLKKLLKKYNIKVNQMHMPYPLNLVNAPRKINDYLQKKVAPKSLEICNFFECKYIVVHGFKINKEDLGWEETEKFLDSLAALAKELGIVICLENLYNSMGKNMCEGPCCEAKMLADRIDRFNKKHNAEVLGACLDTGHANLIGIDIKDFIITLGDRLKVLHIHDNDGISDLHQIPYTFSKVPNNKSTTDWEGFIEGLRQINFDKALSFETAPVLQSFPEGLKEDTIKFIANIGKYFSKEISK